MNVTVALLVALFAAGVFVIYLMSRRRRVRDPTDDDWPLRPPVELSAFIDENGRIELVVDDEEPPLLTSGRRDLRACEHCGRTPIVKRCPNCRLKLCAAHPDCPECGCPL